jgi:hypothetical protein
MLAAAFARHRPRRLEAGVGEEAALIDRPLRSLALLASFLAWPHDWDRAVQGRRRYGIIVPSRNASRGGTHVRV